MPRPKGLQGRAGASDLVLPQPSTEEIVRPDFLTPRLKGDVSTDGFTIIREYAGSTIKRFSIKPDEHSIGTTVSRKALHEVEKSIFAKAVNELTKSPSVEQALRNKVLSTDSSSTPAQSTVVLVDIFERNKGEDKDKDKKIEARSEFHTVCLCRMTDSRILLIDPSSKSISDYLEAPLQEIISGIIIHKHNGDKFYSSSRESPGEYRDCIDIAVKIALTLNETTRKIDRDTLLQKGIENVTQDILQSINFLSNSLVLNQAVGKARDGTYERDLQSSDPEIRKKTLELFERTKDIGELTTIQVTKLTEEAIKDIQEKIAKHKEILTLKKAKVSGEYLDQLDDAYQRVVAFNKELAHSFPTLQVKFSIKETVEDEIIRDKEKDQTSLHLAAISGNVKEFKALLEEYQSPKLKSFISAADKDGQTALHHAAARGHSEIVKSLVSVMKPEEIAAITHDWRYTPLHMAVRGSGDLKAISSIVESILAKAPKIVGWLDQAGQTALHLAADRGNIEVVQALFNGMTPGDICKVRTDTQHTALHFAVHANKPEVVKLLVAKNVPGLLEAQDVNGKTALHWAVINGYSEAALELITVGGAGLGEQDQFGQTALHWAADRGDIRLVQALVNAMTPGEICKVRTDTQHTALHFAVHANKPEIVKLLVDRKVPNLLKAVDVHGQTALHWAAGSGYVEVSRILIEAMTQEDVCKKSNSGNTALDWLRGKEGSEEVVGLLEAKMKGIIEEHEKKMSEASHSADPGVFSAEVSHLSAETESDRKAMGEVKTPSDSGTE